MLRGNLSTRPFYNERLVSFGLLLLALAAAGLSYWNVSTLMRLTDVRAGLDREVQQTEDEAARIRADVQGLLAGIDASRLEVLAAGTAEANALIANRAFSWTRFFDLIEGAVPYEVRIVAVAQRVEDGQQLLTLNLIAQSDADLNELVRAMLQTGAFYDVLPSEKSMNDDGTLGAVVDAFYLPLPAEPNGSTSPVAGGGRP